MCKERNISFLSHDESIDPSKHLNESKLHLNSNGIKIFAENLSRFLDIILLKTISLILPFGDIFKNLILKAWKCQ